MKVTKKLQMAMLDSRILTLDNLKQEPERLFRPNNLDLFKIVDFGQYKGLAISKNVNCES